MPTDFPVTVPVLCLICRKTHTLTASRAQWGAWHAGMYVQDAFPHWTAAQRELLISRTCGTCFDKMFPEEDEFNTDDEEQWGF